MNGTDVFEAFGFSQKEALIYMQLLQSGQTTTKRLSEATGINRVTLYDILSYLMKKGYVGCTRVDNIKHYFAVSPRELLRLLDEKRSSFEAALPELEALQTIAVDRPSVEIYEGGEGYKTMARFLLQYRDQEIVAYVPSNVILFMPVFNLQFRRLRRERNIRLRVITNYSKDTAELVKSNADELRVTRYHDSLLEGVDTAFYVLPEAILYLKFSEEHPLGVYVKDASLARLQRGIFEDLWKKAKKTPR